MSEIEFYFRKDCFYPELVTNYAVSQKMFKKLRLGGKFKDNSNSGGDVVRMKNYWTVIPRINFCRSRTAKNCALCKYSRSAKQCESPIS